MNNRTRNIFILLILILFLLVINFIPVTCIFKQATGISCPSCGMTRAFYSILSFNFKQAFFYNILSIPLFIFIIFSIIMLIHDSFKNEFNYITKLEKILSNKIIIIILLFLILLSFIINNTSIFII